MKKGLIAELCFFRSGGSYIRLEKVPHGGCNLYDMRLCCEMAGVKELNLCVREIHSKSLGARREKKRIVLAPDRKQRWLRLAEVLLKPRIKLHVRCVVEEQIKLNVFVPRPFEQSRVQGV